MHKYFSNEAHWLKLRRVILNTSRYVTDFGLELLSRCVHKNASDLVDATKLYGCVQLFNFLHGSVDPETYLLRDVFKSDSFNGLHMHTNEPNFENSKFESNYFKLVIANESSIDVAHFLKSGQCRKSRESKSSPILFDFNQICFDKNKNTNSRVFNVFQINSVCERFPASLIIPLNFL